MTGNFCPEDPETRIAEGLRASGHIEQVLGQRSCLSALSSMLLLDESQQFPGRTQVGFLWFCFWSPLPPFSFPSCFPVTDHSFSHPCAGAPYSVASKVHQEQRLFYGAQVLICYLLGGMEMVEFSESLQCLLA